MSAPVQIEKRKPLTRAEFGQLMVDQLGRCACGCGEKLQPMGEGVIDEHRVPLALGGTNLLENRHLFRKPCALAKTVDDIARIAKAKAQGGETGQRARREKRGKSSIPARANPWPPKGSVKLKGAGFAKKSAPRSVGTSAASEQKTPIQQGGRSNG